MANIKKWFKNLLPNFLIDQRFSTDIAIICYFVLFIFWYSLMAPTTWKFLKFNISPTLGLKITKLPPRNPIHQGLPILQRGHFNFLKD
jgi:hypothetical protein